VAVPEVTTLESAASVQYPPPVVRRVALTPPIVPAPEIASPLVQTTFRVVAWVVVIGIDAGDPLRDVIAFEAFKTFTEEPEPPV
jgi:hypothetical protein